jgi:hypothetical protein
MLVRPTPAQHVLEFQKYGTLEAPGVRFIYEVRSKDEAAGAVAAALRGGGFPVTENASGSDDSLARLEVDFGTDLSETVRLAAHVARSLGAGETVSELWFEKCGPGPLRAATSRAV